MEVEKVIDPSKTLRSKDVIAQMAADIEAKHGEAKASELGAGKFWEKLSPEQQEELRNFILNPPPDTVALDTAVTGTAADTAVTGTAADTAVTGTAANTAVTDTAAADTNNKI